MHSARTSTPVSSFHPSSGSQVGLGLSTYANPGLDSDSLPSLDVVKKIKKEKTLCCQPIVIHHHVQNIAAKIAGICKDCAPADLAPPKKLFHEDDFSTRQRIRRINRRLGHYFVENIVDVVVSTTGLWKSILNNT